MPNRMPRLGLAITTYNRRGTLLRALADYKRLTSVPFDLVVCDDGSEDGTIEAMRELGVTVLGGVNRGIAWNKNRGLWHLANTCRAEVILLADDDVTPAVYGWEQEWIAAVARLGHVNWLQSAVRDGHILHSGTTASDVGLASVLGGSMIAQSAAALALVGYMDPRFGRYGHEHTDFTNRFIRAGFGGFQQVLPEQVRTVYYFIDGGLRQVAAGSHSRDEDRINNGHLLGQLQYDPIYRLPWRNEAEAVEFQREVCLVWEADLSPPIPVQTAFSSPAYLADFSDVAAAGVDPLSHYLTCGSQEGRAGSFLLPFGPLRQFAAKPSLTKQPDEVPSAVTVHLPEDASNASTDSIQSSLQDVSIFTETLLVATTPISEEDAKAADVGQALQDSSDFAQPAVLGRHSLVDVCRGDRGSDTDRGLDISSGRGLLKDAGMSDGLLQPPQNSGGNGRLSRD